MALPAMAAGVGAAAIWRDRTGQEQDLKVDLRESMYNVNPVIKIVQQLDQAAGQLSADDPIPGSHRPNRPEANRPPTFKLNRLMEADHYGRSVPT